MSRIESECLLGDGIHFTFPQPQCNIFNNKQTETTLRCLAWWREDQRTFIVVNSKEDQVQYVLSYDKTTLQQRRTHEMEAYIYFSPVCTLHPAFKAPGQILYNKLKMYKSARCLSGFSNSECSDENDRYAFECLKKHNFTTLPGGQICRKNCRRCERPPTSESECNFPKNFIGTYLTFDKPNILDSLNIHEDGRLSINLHAEMICKEKKKNQFTYKMVSVFQNGCQPRYSCLDLKVTKPFTQQLSIAYYSSRKDLSVDMCVFEDKPHRKKNTFEHEKHKVNDDVFPNQLDFNTNYITYVSTKRSKQFSCGLDGLISIRASYLSSGETPNMLNDETQENNFNNIRRWKRGVAEGKNEFLNVHTHNIIDLKTKKEVFDKPFYNNYVGNKQTFSSNKIISHYSQKYTCHGKLSDWRPFLCTLEPTLYFTYMDCSDKKLHKEISCEAYTNIGSEMTAIFTKETYNDGSSNAGCLLVFLESPSNNQASQQFRLYKRSLSYHSPNSYKNNQIYNKFNRIENQMYFEGSKKQKQHAPKQWKTAYSLTKSQCSHLIKNQSSLSSFIQQSTTRFDVLTKTSDQPCFHMELVNNTNTSNVHVRYVKYKLNNKQKQEKNTKTKHLEQKLIKQRLDAYNYMNNIPFDTSSVRQHSLSFIITFISLHFSLVPVLNYAVNYFR